MKCNKLNIFTIFIVGLLCLSHTSTVIAQSSTDDSNATKETESNTANDAPETKKIVKTVPNAAAKRMADLKAQYPANQLQKLDADGKEFTALWKEDKRGKAYGALLIVPTDGQTANWPNTIDVLRTDLPHNGWSTLSIDIETHIKMVVPPRELKMDKEMTETPKPPSDTQKPTKSDEDPNLSRIESAVKFLHSKGQFNIILIGYGRSAERILSYSNNADAEGMKRNIRSKASSAMKRPIRAMVLINPQSTDGHSISPQLALFNYLDMPILDMTIGTHYLDVMNAKSRKSNARSAGFENYIQLKVTEPSSTVFGQENRLSRRVRGFLNKYAKGVEVDRR